MKNFISRLTTTLMGFLDEWLSDPEIEDLVTDIRQAMLDCMSMHMASEDQPATYLEQGCFMHQAFKPCGIRARI